MGTRLIYKEKIHAINPLLKRIIYHDSESKKFAFDTKGLTITNVTHPRHIPILDQGQVGSCFSGSTLIPLLDGTTKSIKELTESNKSFWVYSVNENGSIIPGRAIAKLTGINRKVVKVTLDNNKEIIVTPDHEFMLRDGTYKKISEIKFDESLMPLYRRSGPRGYEQLFDNLANKWKFTHSVVNSFINSKYKNIVLERIKNLADRFLVTHHKDFNKHNNNPDNLEWLGELEHCILHSKTKRTEKERERRKKSILKQYLDNPNWNKGSASKGGAATQKKAREDSTFRHRILQGFALGHTLEARKKAAISLSLTLQKPESKKKRSETAKNNMNNYLSIPENRQHYKEIGKALGKNSGRSKAIYYANQIIKKGIELNEASWNDMKKNYSLHNFPKFETVIKNFNSIIELKDAATNYNHKIISFEELEVTENVYCLTVEKYHNFALEVGVFVHNCTGNAGIGALACDPLFSTLPAHAKYTMNEAGALLLYSDAETIDGDGPYPPNDNGSSGLSIAKALKTAGLISSYQHTFTLNDALAAASVTPFIAGINWYSSMFTPDSDGRVHISGGIAGGHEIVCRQIDATNQRVWFDNSWGTSWGVSGRFYLTFADFGTLLNQQGDVTIFSPLTSPSPTPSPAPNPDIAMAAAMRTWLIAKGL